MKKWIVGALLIAGLCVVLEAQITVPNTFTANTRILSSEMNANFSALGDGALNRTGGTMTGSLVTQAVTPGSNNTYDLGVTGTRFRDGWFGRNVAIGGTLGVTGASTFGAAVGVTGTVTATTFSGSGASLTSVPETAIADGSVFPRLAASETVTGVWTLANTAPGIWFDETDGAADNQLWRLVAGAEAFYLEAYNDAVSLSSQPIALNRTGTVIDSIALTATATTVSGSLSAATAAVSGATTAGTLAVGGGTAITSILSNTVTWDPPSLAVGASTTTSVTITGIQASTPCMAGGAPEASAVTGAQVSAYFASGSSNTARLVLTNNGAAPMDVPSGTWRVTCFLY